MITDRDEARPLIIMTPKSLLRHPQTGSPSTELSEGGFQPLLEQKGTGEQPEKVKRLILCSGKVAIDLALGLADLANEAADSIHIARVEQLYPFPTEEIKELTRRLSNLNELVWVQEEPKNMGSWTVIQSYLYELATEGVSVRYLGRPKRSSPATGDPQIHKQEQAWIVQNALNVSKGGNVQ